MMIDLGPSGIERRFTRLPDAFNFGPTGARLWATYISDQPGMQGSFEFIHKVNVPRLFAVSLQQNGIEAKLELRSHEWFPSHSCAVFEGGGLRLTEDKFITWDDCAVDVVTVSGASDVSLRLAYGLTRENEPTGPDWEFGTHGARVYVRTTVTESNDHCQWIVASALGLSPDESEARINRWAGFDDPLAVHIAEYDRYFDGAPEFECSDPEFEAMWKYRWYLLRRNLADPRCGNLPHPLFYEGRSAKMTLRPWNPVGWEFSRLIPFSTPMHLLEARWHGDPSPCQGEVLNLVKSQPDDGLFKCVFIDGTGSDYTDFTAWAAWQLYLVHPDKAWLAQVGPAMVKQVDGVLATYDTDSDFLPTVFNHGATGKEYQPSFFHKGGYPDHPQKSDATPLERVDAACYLYLNASAAAAIMRELGDEAEAGRMDEITSRVRDAILNRMWDADKAFFYDIDAIKHDRLPVENVVGFDPFFAGIAGTEHLAAFDRLTDPEQFWSSAPVRSVSKQSTAYAPDARWNGEHIKGEHGCVWNGPTWPFTNSTVLMALANASRLTNGSLDSTFAELLRNHTSMCFRNGDTRDPMIYEHYNPETGQPISQEEDYLHSTWIDLIVSYVAGICPLPGGELAFRPINCGFDRFSLRGVKVASRTVDVEYDAKSGYVARVDGVEVHRE